MFTVVGYFPKGLKPLQTDTNEPQELLKRIQSVYPYDGTPQFLIVLKSGNLSAMRDFSLPPEVVATFEYGVDYFDQVATLDEAVSTIENFLQNADADQVFRTLKLVTGVEAGKVIPAREAGIEPKIAFNMP